MRVAFILHLYQPPVQDERMFRQICNECYSPLLRLLKQKRGYKVALNIPLSTIELLKKYGYDSILTDIKDLYQSGRVELMGCAAYHPLLTQLPKELVEYEILLNEAGLGSFFGSHQSFEGDPVFMLRGVTGFFAPELALNTNVISTLSSLGYTWALCDEVSLQKKSADSAQPEEDLQSFAYALKDNQTKLVCRDRALSNMVSFKRSLDIADIVDYISSYKGFCSICALDAEVFGHHFKNGIFMLEALIDALLSKGAELHLVSDVVEHMPVKNIDTLVEASWGASDEDILNNIPYPFWLIPGNKGQAKLLELDKLLSEDLKAKINGSGELAVDNSSPALPVIPEEINQVLKFLMSDKYWWLSNKRTVDGNMLLDHKFVLRSLELVENAYSANKKVSSIIKDLRKLLPITP